MKELWTSTCSACPSLLLYTYCSASKHLSLSTAISACPSIHLSICHSACNLLYLSPAITCILSTFLTPEPRLSASLHTGSHGLSILSINCRSLLPKIDHLRVLACNYSPDVIALSETWLDSSISCCELIPGYRMFRRDRSCSGGGVMLYVCDALAVYSWSSHQSLKLLWCVMSSDSGSLLQWYHPRE